MRARWPERDPRDFRKSRHARNAARSSQNKVNRAVPISGARKKRGDSVGTTNAGREMNAITLARFSEIPVPPIV